MKKHPYFKKMEYQTKKGSQNILDKMMLGGRWFFYSGFINDVLSMRRMANNGTFGKKQYAKSSYRILQTIERSGGEFQVDGLVNILKADGPVVFIANHMSTAESMVLPAFVQPLKDVTFVVKQSLIDSPIFGPVMKACNPIAVGRKDPRQDLTRVLTEGVEKLKSGTSIILFPQGTRQSTFQRAKFNSLGIKLAQKAGVRVIPIALKTDFWGHSPIAKEWGPIDRKKKLYFSFGEPMQVGSNPKETHERVLDFIENKLDLWAAQDKKSSKPASILHLKNTKFA